MKKGLFIFALAFTFTGTAQSTEVFEGVPSKAGMFFDLNIGTRISGANSDQVTLGAGMHIDGGIGYMFNGVIGIKGGLGFDTFKAVDENNAGSEDKSLMIRTSLEGVLGIDQLANFGTPEFGLNFHAGFGFSTLTNPSWKQSKLDVAGFEFQDPMFKGNDDMVNIIFGLTPKYIINDNIAINADFSFIMLLKQDFTVDRYNSVVTEGMTNYMTGSVGITYSL